jgi:ATP-dependent helicase/nuclease subunit B
MTGEDGSHLGQLVRGRFAELEDALCERVAELRCGGPLEPLTIIVGSAAVRTRVSDLLVRRSGAVANVSVVTLAGLARDLVAEARGAPPAVLAGLARERVLQRLIADHAGDLRYFGPVLGRPHFARALAATFADLREACVDPESPWAQAVAAPTATTAPEGGRSKAADLDRLYRAYCAALASRKLLDAAAVQLAAAPAAAARSRAHTILYGIYDLNQAQESLASALIAAGADVLVPVPRDADDAGVSALAVARVAGLREHRVAARAPEHDRDLVAAVWRASGTVERLRLSGDGTLAVISLPDERAETREAIRSVVAAVEGGAASWECAVVVPHGEDVERVAGALRAAGLPIACRLPDRSPGPRLLLRLADCLAPLAGEPFARRAVIDLLTAAPLRHGGVPPAESALWLDEARKAGVVSGLGQWTERLGRRRGGLAGRVADLESRSPEPAADDDEAVEKLDALRPRLAAVRSLEAAATMLARACAGLPVRTTWPAWAEALSAVAEALFDSPAGDAARDAAGRLRALDVVQEEVELAVVATIVRELLASGSVPAGRAGRDGVAVLTPLELRGLSFHTVVFTGLAEGGFPARGRPDPILGDAERRRLAEVMGVRITLAEQRDAESLLLFAFACEAARERLLLLAPRTDAASGRPRLPSRVLLRLASLAAGRPVGLDEFLTGAPLAAVWRHAGGVPAYAGDVAWVDERERDTAVLLALSEQGRASAARAYLADVLADPGQTQRRLGAWRASRSPEPGPWDGLLGGSARAALAARHPFAAEMHPTRLERYISCPFAFLLRDLLGLEAPDEPGDSLEMDAREFGTLGHQILQRAYADVIARDLGRDAALVAVTSAWEVSCVEAERRGVTGAALAWEVRREMLREDLLECVRRDPVFAPGGGRPLLVEWRFGESAGLPVALELDDGRRVRFAGRLDRVDVTPGGARVVDYKTGAGRTEQSRIKDGLTVQLPVYLLAVRQTGDADYGAITCLYRLVTRRGGFEDLPLPGDEEAGVARLRELVSGAVSVIDAGMFPRTTRGRCDYCEVGYACGLSAWARARKREHQTLAPVVRLQGPGVKGGDDGS